MSCRAGCGVGYNGGWEDHLHGRVADADPWNVGKFPRGDCFLKNVFY